MLLLEQANAAHLLVNIIKFLVGIESEVKQSTLSTIKAISNQLQKQSKLVYHYPNCAY